MHVGRSLYSNEKEIYVPEHLGRIKSCPVNVTKAERTNTDYVSFEVSACRNSNKVEVRRKDGKNWKMHLKFHCCGYSDEPKKTAANDCNLCLAQRDKNNKNKFFNNQWCVRKDGESHCYNDGIGHKLNTGHPTQCDGKLQRFCDDCQEKTTCKSCHVSIC